MNEAFVYWIFRTCSKNNEKGVKMMPKVLDKSAKIDVYMTEAQKKEVRKIADLHKKSMSEFILETVLSTSTSKAKNDNHNDILILLEKHFSEVNDFQNQQQITMYIMMQFIMWLTSEGKNREDIMAFYESQYQKAVDKFGNGGEK